MAQGSSVRQRARPPAGTPSARPGMPCSQSSPCLLERLIDAEVRDLQPQRIDPHELVRHVVAHDEINLGDVGLALAFDAFPWGVEDLLKRDGHLVLRLRQLTDTDVLHYDFMLDPG